MGLQASILFEPLKLLTCDFSTDPDRAVHSNADPDPHPASKENQIIFILELLSYRGTELRKKQNKNLLLLSLFIYHEALKSDSYCIFMQKIL